MNWELVWLKPAAEPLNVSLTAVHFYLHQPEAPGLNTHHRVDGKHAALTWVGVEGPLSHFQASLLEPHLVWPFTKDQVVMEGQTGPDTMAPRFMRARKPLHHDMVADEKQSLKTTHIRRVSDTSAANSPHSVVPATSCGQTGELQ